MTTSWLQSVLGAFIDDVAFDALFFGSLAVIL
jgi:hypothetical protein